MLSLDRYLTELKTKADALYEDTEVYGIAGWDKESVANSRLYEFCMALPKGAELHAHEMTLLPFEKEPAHSRVFKHELAGKVWRLFFQPASSVLDSLLRKGPLALFYLIPNQVSFRKRRGRQQAFILCRGRIRIRMGVIS